MGKRVKRRPKNDLIKHKIFQFLNLVPVIQNYDADDDDALKIIHQLLNLIYSVHKIFFKALVESVCGLIFGFVLVNRYVTNKCLMLVCAVIETFFFVTFFAKLLCMLQSFFYI